MAIRAELESIEQDFAEALTSGVPATEPAAIAIAERARLHIDRWYYPCSPTRHQQLGQMYVDDPRFAAHYNDRATGLAAYVHDAIIAND